MWRLLMPWGKRVGARHTPARCSRWYRPHYKHLEDRCLLSVSLTSSGPPVPLVGSPVVWTATATDHGSTPVYQFSVGTTGSALHVVRDFSTSNSFTWNPMQEGNYQIKVTVKDNFSVNGGESATETYTAESRVSGGDAVVGPTSNPLVALYSAPPSTGTSMYVQFTPLGSPSSWRSTAQLPIVPGESTNFLVAGLLPNTTYLMRHVLDGGTASAPLTFKTGSLPTSLTFPTFTVQQVPGTDLTQDMVLHIGINPPSGTVDTLTTDLAGNITWYYDPVANNFPSYAPSLVPGGTVLLLGGQQDGVAGADRLREVDLAGDALRETNINAINAELAALGQHPITDFNHDAQRLPNGDTAVLATTPRTIDINGTPTHYEGDMVIVLDQNFQVAWTWDPFAWLDTNRLPTQGEGPDDWTHANAVAWSPADGNLLVSLRAQDWVIKIDYANGTGDGHVRWRLGPGGDFTINSSDPSPWFTHQHDARYVNNSTLVLFDNGNTRQSKDAQAHSRGQELILDETTMQATLVVNADLGNYAPAVGAAQRLPNGSLDFTSGFVEQTIEVLPDGTRTYVLQMNMNGLEYRSYICHTLYGTPANLLDPGFEDPPVGTGTSAYQSNPTGSAWTFSGQAGVAGNGSAITAGNPDAPQGTQVAFLQRTGTISESVYFPADGTYLIDLSAAQRGNNGTSNERVDVRVDGTVVAIFVPVGTDYATYTTGSFRMTAGFHTVTFAGVAPDGADYTALLDRVNIDPVAPRGLANPGSVDLSSAFNRTGIVVDGTTFGSSGLDGVGFALSAHLLGTSLTAGGATFRLGPAGAPDVVSAAGQAITLPAGSYASLQLLATGVNGAQADQQFTVTYADGTTATFTRSISDWAFPKDYAGESTALATSYRDTAAGGRQAGTYNVYGYTLALDPAKPVASLTLPRDANVEVLAIDVLP
jgi:arylsulfate sulfotransferase